MLYYYIHDGKYPAPRFGPSSPGRHRQDVERAAGQLLRSGHCTTVERFRATVKGGSPNTINPLLGAW
jgi:hypothetical protein